MMEFALRALVFIAIAMAASPHPTTTIFNSAGVLVVDNSGVISQERVEYPAALASSVAVKRGQTLAISFTLQEDAPARPQQVFVRLLPHSSPSSPSQRRQQLVFVAEPDDRENAGGQGRRRSFSVMLGDEALGGTISDGGDIASFSLDLLVGDDEIHATSLSNSIWALGRIRLSSIASLSPSSSSSSSPSAPIYSVPLLHESDNALFPLPELPQAPSPPLLPPLPAHDMESPSLSLLSGGTTLLLLLLLLVYIMVAKKLVSPIKVPTGAQASASLFLTSLSLLLGLLLFHWLQGSSSASFITTTPSFFLLILACVAIPLILSGRRMLVELDRAELKKKRS